ncbi:hypothetical protein H6F96_07075 [Microcoleus sp. FACHB-53]|nr:hypothetical protein [Microcoleus sp. FACHB-53]
MLASSTVQIHIAALSLMLLLASRKEEEANGSQEEEVSLIPPVSVQEAAQLGIYLYEKYGGREKFRLPQALAQASPITLKDIDEISDFFENNEFDPRAPGWRSQASPSVEWIRWLLMGGYEARGWAKTVKRITTAVIETP